MFSEDHDHVHDSLQARMTERQDPNQMLELKPLSMHGHMRLCNNSILLMLTEYLFFPTKK